MGYRNTDPQGVPQVGVSHVPALKAKQCITFPSIIPAYLLIKQWRQDATESGVCRFFAPLGPGDSALQPRPFSRRESYGWGGGMFLLGCELERTRFNRDRSEEAGAA